MEPKQSWSFIRFPQKVQLDLNDVIKIEFINSKNNENINLLPFFNFQQPSVYQIHKSWIFFSACRNKTVEKHSGGTRSKHTKKFVFLRKFMSIFFRLRRMAILFFFWEILSIRMRHYYLLHANIYILFLVHAKYRSCAVEAYDIFSSYL